MEIFWIMLTFTKTKFKSIFESCDACTDLCVSMCFDVLYMLCIFMCCTDLCMSMVCERPGSVCVELYRPMCVCVSCEYTQYSPVCGLLGERMVTAPSLCRLQKDACISNTEYKVLHDGPCAGKHTAHTDACLSVNYLKLLLSQKLIEKKKKKIVNLCRF